MNNISNESHSFSKPELAKVVHTHLELLVDFEEQALIGTATLTVEKSLTGDVIILDSYGLNIKWVIDTCGNPLEYHFGKYHDIYGRSLSITLPKFNYKMYKQECTIQIVYKTSPDSPALYWLTPMQTADGKYPFLISNNKLIYARAMFPCQDTPSVKFSYTAKIRVQKNFRVVMSALLIRSSADTSKGLVIYEFLQARAIPSYALIIAVGSLEKRKLNVRTNLFAEKSFIEKFFRTFSSGLIETMLQAAEMWCGCYIWERYDICVLPPSISDFEIECPCMTFIPSTLMYGDSTFISTLALNIVQSWAGSFVTCSSYEHLWLHKSFSTFISRKIISIIMNDEELGCFLERRGRGEVNNMVGKFKSMNLLIYLIPNMKNVLPHEVIKYVPYEKGCMLLCELEKVLGGPLIFKPFFKSFFFKFAFKSIDTYDWKKYLYNYFPNSKQVLDNVPWESFFNRPLCANLELPEMTYMEQNCLNLAIEWCKWNIFTSTPHALLEVIKYDTQKIIFLNYLYAFRTTLTQRKLEVIARHYHFEFYTGQIVFLWFALCIECRWAEKVEAALNFAIEFCSANYACPLFKCLYEWPEIRTTVIKTYIENRKKMLCEVQDKIDKILHLDENH